MSTSLLYHAFGIVGYFYQSTCFIGSVALSNSLQLFFNEINDRFGRKTLNATEPISPSDL